MHGPIQIAGSTEATDIDPAAPELDLLRAVLRNRVLAERLARAPGGWRDLSEQELEQFQLTRDQKRAVSALQELVRRSYPELPHHRLVSSAEVTRVYAHRLGALRQEVMLAIALNCHNRFLEEIELSRGGKHATALSVGDVLRPLLRVGAVGFILVHNHPGGDPLPSFADKVLTEAVRQAAAVVDLVLVDHVIIGGRGGGASSMADLGLISQKGEQDRRQGLQPLQAASDTRLR